MNAVLSLKKIVTVTLGAAAVALAGSSCTAVTAGVAMPDTSAADATSACAEVDAHKVEIPALRAGEPRLRIPQPDGWEGSTDVGRDDESLRFSLSSSSSSGQEPESVVVVGMDEVEDIGTDAIFADGYAGLTEGLEEFGLPTNMTMSRDTVCGLPAQRYTSEGSAASMGAAAAPEAPPASYLQVVARTGGRTYYVGVLAIGLPDSPTFHRDAEAILSGFEVMPSADALI